MVGGRIRTADGAGIALAACDRMPIANDSGLTRSTWMTEQVEEYDGDVTRLWTEAKDGRDLLRRVQQLPGFGKQKAQILVALLAKQVDVRPDGWEAAAGGYAEEGYRSVADVVDPVSLQKVRDYKKAKKAAARAAQPAG